MEKETAFEHSSFLNRIFVLCLTVGVIVPLLLSSGCAARQQSRTLEPETVRTANTSYHGPRYRIAIGKFQNRSPYMRGIFSDGTDRLGMQARQILKNHLSQTNRFVLVDRVNLEEIAREAGYSRRKQNITGGQIVITGAVTEFGRRDTGYKAMGGLITKSKSQIAHGKVSLSIVDVNTSQVLASYQGAGEYLMKTNEVLGIGSSAGYDATLADKVLNLAVIEAVNRLVDGLERGDWSPN